MTPQPPPVIDIVTVAVAIATLLFGPSMAELVGPYAVIVLGAALGGGFSAARRESTSPSPSPLSTIGHMLLMIGLSLMVTVPLAYAVSTHTEIDTKLLLGPVAIIVSAVGHDWPRVGYWFFRHIRSTVENWIVRKGGGQ